MKKVLLLALCIMSLMVYSQNNNNIIDPILMESLVNSRYIPEEPLRPNFDFSVPTSPTDKEQHELNEIRERAIYLAKKSPLLFGKDPNEHSTFSLGGDFAPHIGEREININDSHTKIGGEYYAKSKTYLEGFDNENYDAKHQSTNFFVWGIFLFLVLSLIIYMNIKKDDSEDLILKTVPLLKMEKESILTINNSFESRCLGRYLYEINFETNYLGNGIEYAHPKRIDTEILLNKQSKKIILKQNVKVVEFNLIGKSFSSNGYKVYPVLSAKNVVFSIGVSSKDAYCKIDSHDIGSLFTNK